MKGEYEKTNSSGSHVSRTVFPGMCMCVREGAREAKETRSGQICQVIEIQSGICPGFYVTWYVNY